MYVIVCIIVSCRKNIRFVGYRYIISKKRNLFSTILYNIHLKSQREKRL
jgi:hypothetical protein